MSWLDPRVRCNHCGIPFAEGSAAVCPGCGAALAEVGTQSELRDWGVTRQRGRRWFVWVRCVLGVGGFLALISCATTAAVRRSTDPVEYLIFSVPWLVGWYVIGRLHWRGAEREYAAWVAGGVAAEPSAPADRGGR